MARKTRIEFPGAVYHLLDRGDRREAIYRDETDRRRFLDTLGEVCRRTGWRVHAFVLMSNHYHLLVETPQANLVAGMRWLQSTWAIRFNRRHRVSGHLFQGRYKSIVVDPEEGSYLVILSDYIHLNPVRAGLVKLEGRLFDYQWSSYPLYAAARGRPEWFQPRRVLGELDLADTAAGRKHYAERMRQRAVEESTAGASESRGLERGWCLGGPSFRERALGLLEGAGEKLGRAQAPPRNGEMRRSHQRDEAERILRAGLRYFGLEAEALTALKKNDPRKLAMARLIRRQTDVDNRWIAQALALGHASSVSHCLRSGAADQDAALAGAVLGEGVGKLDLPAGD